MSGVDNMKPSERVAFYRQRAHDLRVLLRTMQTPAARVGLEEIIADYELLASRVANDDALS